MHPVPQLFITAPLPAMKNQHHPSGDLWEAAETQETSGRNPILGGDVCVWRSQPCGREEGLSVGGGCVFRDWRGACPATPTLESPSFVSLTPCRLPWRPLIEKHWVFLVRLWESEEGGPWLWSPVEIVPRARAVSFKGGAAVMREMLPHPSPQRSPKDQERGRGSSCCAMIQHNSCLIWMMSGTPP